MKIASISMATRANNSFKAAKKEEAKPLIDLSDKKPDDIVGYSTWGGNYAYPVFAKDIVPVKKEPVATVVAKPETAVSKEVSPEKLFSAEWFM